MPCYYYLVSINYDDIMVCLCITENSTSVVFPGVKLLVKFTLC